MAKRTLATQLLLDELRVQIMDHDKGAKKREKYSGYIPRGLDCVFGDYPEDYVKNYPHKEWKQTVLPTPLRVTDSLKLYGKSTFQRRPIEPTMFRRMYDRGQLPVHVLHHNHHQKHNTLDWRIDINSIDYLRYLPIFIEGIREKEDPYRFLAVEATCELIDNASGTDKIIPTIPHIIVPLKAASNTRDPILVRLTAQIITMLVRTHSLVASSLVPYYRTLLPVFALFAKHDDVVMAMIDTLEELGGPTAYAAIKSVMPTFERHE